MRLAIRQPSAMMASSHAPTPTIFAPLRPGLNSPRRAATSTTGHSIGIATVRQGTYALRSGPRCAHAAITQGSAISDQRAPADGDCALAAVYRPVPYMIQRDSIATYAEAI